MEEVVYLDVYFLINSVMDAVSFLVAGLILGEKMGFWRCILSGIVGGVFSVFMLFSAWSDGVTLLLSSLFFVPLLLLAFGKRSPKRFFFLYLFSLLTALFLGGALEFVSYYTASLGGNTRGGVGVFCFVIFSAFGLWNLWGRGLHRRMQTLVIPLSIFHRGKREELYGLLDSGSFLRDPQEGRYVILLKAEFAGALFSPHEMERIRMGEEKGVVEIPMQTAAGTGFLFAFSPDRICFHAPKKAKKKGSKDCLVALDFSGGGFAGCPCLIPLGAL